MAPQITRTEGWRLDDAFDEKVVAGLRGKDYIETKDWTDEELEVALENAADLKFKFRNGIPHRVLPDKTVFLLFFDKSTRTRNSFEAGATQLGAHAHFIDAETSQLSHGESPKDMGVILSSYGHAIAIRHDLVPGEGNSLMREVAKHSDRPVFNMQCDIDHPFQTLADLMTIREKFGRDLRGLKIAVSWAYAPSYAKPMSVPQGLIMLMTRFGLDVTLAHPPEWKLMKDTMTTAEQNARKRTAPSSRWRTTWRTPSGTPTSCTPRAGASRNCSAGRRRRLSCPRSTRTGSARRS